MNCWEYMDCPDEARRECPAYPSNGTDCWKMPNTMCAGGRISLSTLAEKVAFCRSCDFYMHYVRRKVLEHLDNPVVGNPDTP